MEKLKREMGSITVVVFATVTFILIILSTIYVTISQKRKSQAIEIQELKETYDMDMQQAYEERLAAHTIDKIKTEGGTVLDIPTESEGLKNYYGEKVVNFKSVPGVEWQLFYDDEDYYYLIASDYVLGSKLPSDLKHGANTLQYQAWFYSTAEGNNNSTFLNSGKWPQGASLIKDTKYIKWVDKYPSSTKMSGEIEGVKATGGPTLEMFIKSYNAAHPSNQLSEINQFDSTNSNEYGYIGIYDGLDNTEDNMWIIKTTTKAYGYWIAYPYGNVSYERIYYANCNGSVEQSKMYENYQKCGFRPLVAIPKNN